ncbi:unnamed protein product [Phytophthora fragariaefolia]|uniref:Unnamed protein product n=1 Tax=Phytophthora fragariaefolia TaxID=1490495 RepID=A0A9W6TWW3_9STRA|nr:unnamed protein product [Phytophthora fragariaefolia]
MQLIVHKACHSNVLLLDYLQDACGVQLGVNLKIQPNRDRHVADFFRRRLSRTDAPRPVKDLVLTFDSAGLPTPRLKTQTTATMDSMLNKAKEAAGKYTGHGDSHSHGHENESKLHHLKHEAEKKVMKHQAKNYAEDHGFSKKKHHHDNQDESLLGKAKDAVGKVTGHGDSHSHSHKKDNQDESVLDKAKEMVNKVTGHGDSHSHSHKKDKDDDSIFDKAKEAVEKYTKKH